MSVVDFDVMLWPDVSPTEVKELQGSFNRGFLLEGGLKSRDAEDVDSLGLAELISHGEELLLASLLTRLVNSFT